MQKNSRIYVAGHRGLIGSAIYRKLQAKGYQQLIVADHSQLDLLDQNKVKAFFQKEKPEVVFVCAAKVGGIHANNTLRADFIYDNLQIQNNVIWSAHEHDCKKLVFLGSSCIYPRMCPQPMSEEHLLTGEMEFTNRPYAIAKIAGLELINSLVQQYGRRYFSVMPTNLYGPGDNFNIENAHVLPALLRRFHEATVANSSEIKIWGSGKPLREFLYSEDCGDAIVFLAEKVDEAFFSSRFDTRQQFFHINVGSGQEVSIADLAKTIASVVGYKGRLSFDASKPDGTPRKLLDCSKLFALGWKPQTGLREGITKSYRWFLEHLEKGDLKC